MNACGRSIQAHPNHHRGLTTRPPNRSIGLLADRAAGGAASGSIHHPPASSAAASTPPNTHPILGATRDESSGMDSPARSAAAAARGGMSSLPPGMVAEGQNDAHSRSRVGSPTAAEELEEGADAFQESVIRFHLAMTDAHMAAAAAAGGGGGADSAAQQAALRRVFEELGAMRAELYVGSGAEDDDGQAAPQRAVQEEMLADCERKAGEVMLNLLRRATSAVAPDPEAAPGLFYECVRLRQEAKVGACVDRFLWMMSCLRAACLAEQAGFVGGCWLIPDSSRSPPHTYMCAPGGQHLRRLPAAPAGGGDGRGAQGLGRRALAAAAAARPERQHGGGRGHQCA